MSLPDRNVVALVRVKAGGDLPEDLGPRRFGTNPRGRRRGESRR